MKDDFKSKEEIVECLVEEWGYRESQFYNSKTNKSIERIWTYNRCLQHLFDLRRNYIRTDHGRRHKFLG